MLGLLNSHVDPPNSLLSLCVSVFCLRGSGSEPPPPNPLPVTCTHTLRRLFFWRPTQLSVSPACQIHHRNGISYLGGGLRGAKVDSDVVSDKLLYRTETPTGPLHIHGLIQIPPLYVGSCRKLRKTRQPRPQLQPLQRRKLHPCLKGSFCCRRNSA